MRLFLFPAHPRFQIKLVEEMRISMNYRDVTDSGDRPDGRILAWLASTRLHALAAGRGTFLGWISETGERALARRLVMVLFALIGLPAGTYVSYTYLVVHYVPPVFLGELEKSDRGETAQAGITFNGRIPNSSIKFEWRRVPGVIDDVISLGFGTPGWNPEEVLASSFAPSRAGEATGARAFGVSFASTLGRPMGWEGSGALETGGDSVDLAWRPSVADAGNVRPDVTNRAMHLALRNDPLPRFSDALLGSVDLEASFRPHRLVTVPARPETERPVSAAGGSIRDAVGVDESGVASNRDVTIDGRDVLLILPH